MSHHVWHQGKFVFVLALRVKPCTFSACPLPLTYLHTTSKQAFQKCSHKSELRKSMYSYVFSFKKINQGNSLVGKMLVVQAWGSEFNSQYPCKKMGTVAPLIILVLGRPGREDPGGHWPAASLVKSASFQVPGRDLSQKTEWTAPEE